MMTEVDVDGNGSINYTEFLKLMKDSEIADPEAEKDMMEAFRVFDTEGNGFINSDVLRHVMTNIGESLTEEESQDFIKLIDADGDGLVNYQELIKILSNWHWGWRLIMYTMRSEPLIQIIMIVTNREIER